jgi:hypothetical protein
MIHYRYFLFLYGRLHVGQSINEEEKQKMPSGIASAEKEIGMYRAESPTPSYNRIA